MVFYIVMFISYTNSLGCFISFISHWILPKTAPVYNNFITLLIKRFPTSQLWHFLSSRVPLVFNGVRQNYHLPTCNLRSIINAGKHQVGFLIVTVSHFCFYLKGITGFEGFFLLLYCRIFSWNFMIEII